MKRIETGFGKEFGKLRLIVMLRDKGAKNGSRSRSEMIAIEKGEEPDLDEMLTAAMNGILKSGRKGVS